MRLKTIKNRIDAIAARHVDQWPGWPALLIVANADGSFSEADRATEQRARAEGRHVLRVLPPPPRGEEVPQ